MENKHFIQLDGLRFYAVLMVMVAHWLQWQWQSVILKSIPFAFGVTLFFVLSGFLISRILFSYKEEYSLKQKNRGTLIKRFFARRSLRIFPVYFITLSILFIFNFERTRELFLWLATYTINIYQGVNNDDIGHLTHFWSLAVEEQFYLIWPFLILFTGRRTTLFVIILMIVFAVCGKTYVFATTYNWRASSYLPWFCMDSLGLGALIAYLSVYKKDLALKLSQPLFLCIGIGVYLTFFLIKLSVSFDVYGPALDYFLFSVAIAFMILRASQQGFIGPAKFLLENRFVNYSGRISYGMYIFHNFISILTPWIYPDLSTINYGFTWGPYVVFIVNYLVTFIIAHFSFVFLEKPINSLKRKFEYI